MMKILNKAWVKTKVRLKNLREFFAENIINDVSLAAPLVRQRGAILSFDIKNIVRSKLMRAEIEAAKKLELKYPFLPETRK